MAELLSEEDAMRLAALQPWGLAAKDEDYQRALSQDSWTAHEAICWLNGRNPIWCRGDIQAHYPEEADAVMRAIKAGKLSRDSSPPEQWIAWARGKGWEIPSPLLIRVCPDNKKPKKKSGPRKDNLRRAIDAAIEKIGRKPSLDELWQFFQDDKDETGFIDDFDDAKIIWRDTKGELHDTTKKTIANRLSSIKI